jgi:hypothetical protein
MDMRNLTRRQKVAFDELTELEIWSKERILQEIFYQRFKFKST